MLYKVVTLYSKTLFVYKLLMENRPHTLSKSERMSQKSLIDNLFSGGNKSFSSFPLRVVYKELETGKDVPRAMVLISVPKKNIKRAVMRNRVKRQVRDAYRKHKYLLLDELEAKGKYLLVAFIWIHHDLNNSTVVDQTVKNLLLHITEHIK